MNYDIYLLSQLLVNQGSSVNGISFESMPYDEQYELLPEIWEFFSSSKYNDDSLPLYECLVNFLTQYQNIIVDIKLKEFNEIMNIVISSCREGISGDWDCCSDEGKQGFEDMITLLYKAKYLINK